MWIWSCASWIRSTCGTLNSYNKIVNQRNRLLKDIGFQPELAGTLDVWDMQLAGYAKRIIRRRAAFRAGAGRHHPRGA